MPFNILEVLGKRAERLERAVREAVEQVTVLRGALAEVRFEQGQFAELIRAEEDSKAEAEAKRAQDSAREAFGGYDDDDDAVGKRNFGVS